MTPTVLGSAPAPVVTVTYTTISGTGVNVTNELDPLGQSSSGNVFNFDSTSNTWWFNLATSPFTASGTYTVTLQSGDVNHYSVFTTVLGHVRKAVSDLAMPADVTD